MVGRPLAWAQHDDENSSFRQCLARIRYVTRCFYLTFHFSISYNFPSLQERRNLFAIKSKLRDAIAPVRLGDGPKVTGNKVLVILDKGAEGTKAVAANGMWISLKRKKEWEKAWTFDQFS